MKLVEWNDELVLGIPPIDEQHKKLVDMLNGFYSQLEKGEKEEAIYQFLHDLEEYLNFHLDYEERFMEKIGFPELGNHKKTHEMFKKLYAEEKEKFAKEKDIKAVRELVAFTYSWLFSHIMKTDKKYIKYLKEKLKERKDDTVFA